MNVSQLTGVCTALVTPFLNGEVNYPMLQRLIRRQMDAGIKAILVCGTTGESATLSDAEKLRILEKTREYAGSDCIILAGTGSNDTAHAVALSKAAESCGADGLLIVSPYYNKATPEGLLAHYLAIAREVSLPILVYNVPSRTGLDIPVSVYKALSAVPNIIGVKEASSDIDRVLNIRAECPQDFRILSGNDSMTVPIISIGGKGVISVVSNVCPGLVQAMTNAALDGDFDTAASLQTELYPLTRALFRQVNPIPVKAAMKHLGFDCGECRLPLTAASDEVISQIKSLLR